MSCKSQQLLREKRSSSHHLLNITHHMSPSLVPTNKNQTFCIFISYEQFLCYAFVFSLTDYLSKRMRSVIQLKSYLGSGRD